MIETHNQTQTKTQKRNQNLANCNRPIRWLPSSLFHSLLGVWNRKIVHQVCGIVKQFTRCVELEPSVTEFVSCQESIPSSKVSSHYTSNQLWCVELDFQLQNMYLESTPNQQAATYISMGTSQACQQVAIITGIPGGIKFPSRQGSRLLHSY